MRGIAERLAEHRDDIPMPDHTAAGDVECLRACYMAAQELYAAAETTIR
jgi:hypothetical protein